MAVSKMFLIATCFITILCNTFKLCTAVQVTIEQGTLRGTDLTLVSRNGTEYNAFLSIPFAKPPIDELRFEPPQQPDSWDGVRDAIEPPQSCVQKDIITIEADTAKVTGQEDCLYLNVYSPKTKKQSDLFPVMVFIHGGAFVNGSTGWYQPEYFMDHQVVMVTIQYRLNVFGFLSTGDQVLPGNNGMKDQVAALEWVKKNIKAFGGNPNKVTIFGQSAGAGSVHYHLHSSLSKGLFHAAISQSGTSLGVWAYTPRTLAQRRAKMLGALTWCPTKNSRALVDCLKKLTAEELALAHHKFYAWDFEPTTPFSVVDEPTDVERAFITENPWYHEVVNNVPWIVGFTSAEGGVKAGRLLSNDGALATILDNNYKRLFPITLFYGSWIQDEAKIAETTEKLKEFYFSDKSIGTNTAHELVELYSDGFFTYSSLEAAQRHKGTVYFYYYDHRNEGTFNQIMTNFKGDLGVCHGDDLISLFYVPDLFKVTAGNDLAVSERLIGYWVNFAKTGNPNESNREGVWKPFKNNFEYLHITTDADKMEQELIKGRYDFWKGLELIPPRSQPPKNKIMSFLDVITRCYNTLINTLNECLC